MIYDDYQPYIGVTGRKHPSKAEARASFRLQGVGILPSNAFYKGSLYDRYGIPFKAKTDFQHCSTDLKVEFKAGILNAHDNKQSADNAMKSARIDFSLGKTSAGQFATQRQKHDWSNSLSKQLAVQKQQTPLNMVVTFESLPHPIEKARLNRMGLVWTTLDSIGAYALFAELANLGHEVAYANHGYRISTIASHQLPAKQ